MGYPDPPWMNPPYSHGFIINHHELRVQRGDQINQDVSRRFTVLLASMPA